MLSADNKKQLWIPEGFAHGFVVLSESAEFLYKTTDYWSPEFERSVLWNDTDLNISWPIATAPLLSAKDAKAAILAGRCRGFCLMQQFSISPREMLGSLVRHRGLIKALIQREVVGRYRGSVMGILCRSLIHC